MTLLCTIFAAIACTVIWYTSEKARRMKTGILCLMFWGASVMWLIDAAVEYADMGVAFFSPDASEMLNDTFLGLTVTAFGLVVWLVILLVSDPDGVVKSLFSKNKV